MLHEIRNGARTLETTIEYLQISTKWSRNYICVTSKKNYFFFLNEKNDVTKKKCAKIGKFSKTNLLKVICSDKSLLISSRNYLPIKVGKN